MTDNYIPTGKIGALKLSSACYNWYEVLRLAAKELHAKGEADAARARLRSGSITVRRFLDERFGILTGARQAWHRPNWTPDRADLHEFLKTMQQVQN